MLHERKYSFGSLEGAAVKIGPTAAAYDTKDMHHRLEVVATLDIHNNARTNWVLFWRRRKKARQHTCHNLAAQVCRELTVVKVTRVWRSDYVVGNIPIVA